MRVPALIVGLAVGLLAAVPQLAVAQTDARPILDSAPAEVSYRGAAIVRGHMAGGTGGEAITLQKMKTGGWRDLQTRTAHDDGRVEFRLDGLTSTADYRLVWDDPEEGREAGDGRARIRVAARVTLEVARHHVMSGRRVRVEGWVLPAAPERRVVLQQKVEGEWHFVERKRVVDGRFTHEFRVRSKGYRLLRAVFAGDERNTAGRASDFVKVYSRSYATWYGPGLYGNRTACGKRLRSTTLGVAHRSLPCGTDVGILYRGRTITVPVIDRGPYSHGANWDLTEATARRLRFRSSDNIGVSR